MNHKSGLKNMYNNVEYGYSKKKYNSSTEVYNSFISNGSIIKLTDKLHRIATIIKHLTKIKCKRIKANKINRPKILIKDKMNMKTMKFKKTRQLNKNQKMHIL
jgi:hypothetical protein